MDFLTIGLISLAAGGTTYFLLDTGAGIADLAVKLDYEFKVKVFKFQGLSLKMVIDFILKNPTDKQLRISHPLIMLYYVGGSEENFLAQNTVYNREYILPAYGNVVIPNLDFNVSVSDLVSVVAGSLSSDLLTLWQNRQYAKLAQSLSQSIDFIRQNIIYKAFFKVNGAEIKYQSNLEGLGYSPLSAIERPIKDGSEFDKYFPLPQGKREIVIKDGEVDDTVRKMHEIVKQDAHLIREFSQLFKAPTRYETAQKIYDWIYNYLKYNLEEGEQLKNPLVSYHLGQRRAREFFRKNGYYNPKYSVDCDDISIFVASILHNLGLPYAFRVAAYSPSRGYQHVYTITWDEKGNEIIIDPVYWRFNAEKPYVKEKTVQALDGIPVEYLYGIDDTADTVLNLIKSARTALATDYFGTVKGKHLLLQMYDYLLQYWDSPHRSQAIDILARKEAELCHQGKIARHNLFRLLRQYGSLGSFSDWFKRNTQNFLMIANPLTSPIGWYNLLTGKGTQSQSTQKKTTTPYSDTVSTGRSASQPVPADSMCCSEPKESFWQKLKTPLIVGGTVIALGSAGFFFYKTTKSKGK